MSTPGAGNTDGERRSTPDDGSERAGNDYQPGAYSADDDTSGDYVPGMYAEDTATREHRITPEQTPTRVHGATPISASRDTDDARTDAHPPVVPVKTSKNPWKNRKIRSDAAPVTREQRLTSTAGTGLPSLEDRKLLHQREKEHFGGMKFGAAFFGWLTATGMFVLLSALVGAVAALFGVGGDLSTADISSGSGEAQAAGITAAVLLGLILLASYYAGGYVAGRMARFSGLKQGVAVWLWAVIIAVIFTVIGLIIGNQANVTEQLQGLGFPSTTDLTGPGLLGLLIIAVIALIGAILGGLAGMRYHRRIDRTDFDTLGPAG